MIDSIGDINFMYLYDLLIFIPVYHSTCLMMGISLLPRLEKCVFGYPNPTQKMKKTLQSLGGFNNF